MTYYTPFETPLGRFLLVSDGESLTAIDFECPEDGVTADEWQLDPGHPVLSDAARQLTEFFAGERREFALPLNPRGTAFQKRVWAELGKIPYGVTISYGELARRIGDPNASRAVGLANGRNPIPIVIPCHRVIGSAGRLVGYGGGLPRKEALLKLEGALGGLF